MMPGNPLTPLIDKTRNILLYLAMDANALPTMFVVIGAVLVLHSMRACKPAVDHFQVPPVGTSWLSDQGVL
jgi:hypothetical protein